MINKKNTILFGAGAEAEQFAFGDEFLKDVMGIDSENPKRMEDINQNIAKYIKEKRLLNPDFYPDFTKEAKKFEIDDLYEICLRNFYLSQCDSKTDVDRKVEEMKNDKEKSKDDFISENPSYLGLIDSYFYTLIQPKTLGKDKFWSVIFCYYRAYLSLIMAFFDDETNKNADYILNHPVEVYCSMKKKCEEIIKGGTNKYYSFLNHNHININFVTTNYTPFGQILSEDCVYLHGRFNLFESAYSRNVIDINTKQKSLDDDLYFPYIFIQSGIKPIIERNEIEEYNKFIGYLDSSEVLYVLGYRFNPDDSEIISLVRDYLQKRKKMIYFQYQKSIDDKLTLDFKNIFRICDDSNIETKYINKDDISEFEKALSIYI